MTHQKWCIVQLTEFAVRQSVIDEIYLGYDGLISKTNKKIKSAFFKHALDVMNEKLPKEQTQKILEANACCKSGARIKASKEFAKGEHRYDDDKK